MLPYFRRVYLLPLSIDDAPGPTRWARPPGSPLLVLHAPFDRRIKGTDEIEGQLGVYQSDLRRDFGRRLQEVENVVYELNDRADAFFDETLRLARVFDLFNADRLRSEFDRRVVAAFRRVPPGE